MKLSDLDDLNLLTALIVGEAAGEPLLGKIAVACVARNRVKSSRWPDTYKDVSLQRKQFSCFNDSTKSLKLTQSHFDETWWRECRFAAHGVLYNWYGDVTHGANHYCRHDCYPYWRDELKFTVAIGDHRFYRL